MLVTTFGIAYWLFVRSVGGLAPYKSDNFILNFKSTLKSL